MRSSVQRLAQLPLRSPSTLYAAPSSSSSLGPARAFSSFSSSSFASASFSMSQKLALSLAALGLATGAGASSLCSGMLSSSASSSSADASYPDSSPSTTSSGLSISSLFVPSLHADAPPTPPPSAQSQDNLNMGVTFTKPPSSVDLASLDDDSDNSKDESKKGRRRVKKVRVKRRQRKKTKAVKRPPPCKYDDLDMAAKATLMDFAHLVFGAGLTLQTNPLQDPMNMEVSGKQNKHLELATVVDLNLQEPTQLTGTVVLGPEQSTILHGSIDTDFGVKGRLVTKGLLLDNSDMEMHFGLATRPDRAMYNNFVLVAGYKGSDWHWSGTAVNGVGTMCTSYVQTVTPHLLLGLDLTHQWGKTTKLSCGGRYQVLNDDKTGNVLAASLSDRECSFSYTRHASPSLSLATDIKYSPASGDLVSRAGLHLKHRTFSFQGVVDSQGTQMATLENRVLPTLSVSLSGIVSHAQERSMWGVNVMMVI